MVRVENGVVTEARLPRRGRLQDGRSVSNYHLLDPAILKAEGWLPLVDEPPAHNPETEVLQHVGYDIRADSVTKLYEVEPILGLE